MILYEIRILIRRKLENKFSKLKKILVFYECKFRQIK